MDGFYVAAMLYQESRMPDFSDFASYAKSTLYAYTLVLPCSRHGIATLPRHTGHDCYQRPD